MDSIGSGDCFLDALLEGDTVTGSQYVATSDQTSIGIDETETRQKKVKRLGNFSADEDIVLISAWLNTSMNPLVGTNQKGKTFWSNIANNFYENTTALSRERTERSLVCRYGDIQKAVNKFIGILTQVENSHPSGYNEQDNIQKAKSMYQEIVGTHFKYEHCWNLLRHQPKWLDTCRVAGRKRQGTTSSPSTPTSVNLVEDNTHSDSFIDLERPMGKKAEKAKQKRKGKGVDDNPLSDFICDWKVEKLKMYEHKMKIEEEKLSMAKQEMKLKETKEEMKVMMMDVSCLNEEQKEYIQMLRSDILAKKISM